MAKIIKAKVGKRTQIAPRCAAKTIYEVYWPEDEEWTLWDYGPTGSLDKAKAWATTADAVIVQIDLPEIKGA